MKGISFMKMKVLTLITASQKVQRNAGPKAPGDICTILEHAYNATCVTFIRDKYYRYKMLFEFMKCRFFSGVIVLQHPLLFQAKMYTFLPKDRTIILIHDIAGLRAQNEEQLKKEIAIFKQFKYIIAHNSCMRDFLVEQGLDPSSIYLLEIFDYLANGNLSSPLPVTNNSIPEIIYPGNLAQDKAPFVYQLDEEKMAFKINLYGQGIHTDICEKISYMGSFMPDELSQLQGDLGLIWDGNFDESDEDKLLKHYTKYNNPHKVSCCLAAGKPVIVWRKSAMADFVRRNNIGYEINNLYDINKLDLSELSEKKINAVALGEQLRQGVYTRKIFDHILKKIGI